MNTILDVRAAQFANRGLALYPEANFTCSGSILSWTFGAEWNGNSESFTELQIWRSSGDGSYTKVGSTTIMTERNISRFYHYPLSSPLPFQEGDILGYFQPHIVESPLNIQYELDGQPQRTYYFDESFKSANVVQLTNRTFQERFQALINPETGELVLNYDVMHMSVMKGGTVYMQTLQIVSVVS